MEQQTGKRALITVFVRGTDNVPAPVDLSERPEIYLDIELAHAVERLSGREKFVGNCGDLEINSPLDW